MEASSQREPEINKLFRLAKKYKADLYLHVGLAPMFKIKGVAREALLPPLSHQDLHHLVLPILTAEQQHHLDQEEVTFAYVVEKDSVFRLNVSKKRGQLSLSARWVEAY
jgi:Tfp pilus assembly pilus retraction ATPase PilT